MAKSTKTLNATQLAEVKSSMNSSIPASKKLRDKWVAVVNGNGKHISHTIGDDAEVVNSIKGGTPKKPWEMWICQDSETSWVQSSEKIRVGSTLKLYFGPAKEGDQEEDYIYRWG